MSGALTPVRVTSVGYRADAAWAEGLRFNLPVDLLSRLNCQVTSSGEKAWKMWYKRFFAFIEANDVKAVSYINSNWEAQPMWKGQNWGDARVQANPFIKSQWELETSKGRYLHSDDGLFEAIGYEGNP